MAARAENDYDDYEEDGYGRAGPKLVPPIGSFGTLGPRVVPNKRRKEDVQGEETVVVTHEGGTYELDGESEPALGGRDEDGGDEYGDAGDSEEEIGDYGPIRGTIAKAGRPDALRTTKMESGTVADAVAPSVGPKPSQKCLETGGSEPEISPISRALEGAEHAMRASESQD